MKVSTLLLPGLALTMLGISACSKENVNTSPDFDKDTILFGSFFGECEGESCVDIYRLDTKNQTLAEDTQDQYPNGDTPYNGTYVARSQADYTLVKDLIQQVPAELVNERNPVIGMPDYTDAGGYYIEVTQAGKRRYWLIDTQKNNLPSYLRAFADTLDIRLGKLR
ncbi:hypothetical protein LGH70_10600 [Hymenobacter sp. BT635]|uniref:Lipoprotein n=1 Tax=Hymenobacter nitidus TaxID=2880929 RepID=A0ABS8AC99_9BACT|nr:hypothetical protein [Hymenobacter nitidus]MCB2378033.1 hypothetical protein [Hymenobacter nitidus]